MTRRKKWLMEVENEKSLFGEAETIGGAIKCGVLQVSLSSFICFNFDSLCGGVPCRRDYISGVDSGKSNKLTN